jgi:hypothetical protein
MTLFALPSLPPADAAQLLQLRQLQLRRAQAALAEALEAEARAQQALERRHDKVTRLRSSRLGLMTALTGRLAACLPQWSPWAGAQRAWLDEQVEREAYALIGDEQALEQAQDERAERQRELARCEHREALAQDLLREQRRQQARDDERRQDSAREDLPAGGPAW